MDRPMNPVLPVSVIIPCHDAAATLTRAVESVARQTASPAEVILVDDASRDSTPVVIAELSRQPWPFRVQCLRLPENRGAGEARNAGLRAAAADSRYLAFLDADDVWLPAKLERQIAWMEAHPEVAWTAHRCGIMGDAVAESRTSVATVARSITRTGLLARNAVATPTVVARRPMHKLFRAEWRWCEDLMLWIDWLDDGCRGVLLDESLAMLGRRPTAPGGSTGNLEAMYAGERRVIGTLVRERRMAWLAGQAWQGYAWARYLRRRARA